MLHQEVDSLEQTMTAHYAKLASGAALLAMVCYSTIVMIDFSEFYYQETLWQRALNIVGLCIVLSLLHYGSRKVYGKLFCRFKQALTDPQEAYNSQEYAQLLHDLRSPLGSLRVLLKSHSLDSLAKTPAIINLLQRIDGLSRQFLRDFKQGVKQAARTHSVAMHQDSLTLIDPIPTLTQLLEQKRMEYQQHAALTLTLDIKPTLSGVRIEVDAAGLQRVLSNLINNAVEANQYQGQVQVICSVVADRLRIVIRDQGPGMSQALFHQLGHRLISHGKAEGIGLGFLSAKQTITAWGGELCIDSCHVGGTSISIYLPSRFELDAVLIDDDDMVGYAWTESAKSCEKHLQLFHSAHEFLQRDKAIAKNTPIYVDVNLANNERGDELAKLLVSQGFTDVYLASAYLSKDVPKVIGIKGIRDKQPPWLTERQETFSPGLKSHLDQTRF